MAVVVMTWWLTLAPTAVGGPASYVVVVGSSMEPRWHTGDIIVTRARRSYGVGDVVAMDTGSGRAIHRIVGGSAQGGFTTQGDNRETADGWTIQHDDVIGEAWFTAPVTIDRVVRFGPLLAGLLAFLLVAWPSRRPDPGAASEPAEAPVLAGTEA